MLLALLARRAPGALRTLGLAALLMLADTVCVYLPVLLGARGLAWAWLGKLSELGLLACVVTRTSGAGRPQGRHWLAWAALVGLVAAVPAIVAHHREPLPNPATLLYQATMPGLAEELMYRGVLLGLLDEILGRPWRFLGLRWGAGALLTTWAFFLNHVLGFGPHWEFTVDLGPGLDFAWFGFSMCYLRYRFESVWPAALAHNVCNVATVVLH